MVVWARWFAAITFAAFVAALVTLSPQEYRLSADEVQAVLDTQLPKETRKGHRINEVKVAFDGDVLSLVGSGIVRLGRKQEFSVTGSAVGALSYRALDGTFHFVPQRVSVSKLEAARPLGKVAVKLPGSQVLAEKALVSALRRFHVYKLKPNTAGRVAYATLNAVFVEEGKLVIRAKLVDPVRFLFTMALALALLYAAGFALRGRGG